MDARREGARIEQYDSAGTGRPDASDFVDRAFEPQTLYVGEAQFPAVTPDGSAVLFCNNPQSAQWDIWRLPLRGDHIAEPFLTSPHLEVAPSFSPDGQWVAYGYRSQESGPGEIWVRPYPGPGAAHLVSSGTSFSPQWSRDGDEIFFESEGRMMSAAVRFRPEFSIAPPRMLFTIPEDIVVTWRFFDATEDGDRFLMIRKEPFELRPLELVIVPNWIAELESRLARN